MMYLAVAVSCGILGYLAGCCISKKAIDKAVEERDAVLKRNAKYFLHNYELEKENKKLKSQIEELEASK